jgi:hypothetical protein
MEVVMKGFWGRMVAFTAARIRVVTATVAVAGTLVILFFNQESSYQVIFGQIAALINLVAYLPYLTSILMLQTKPSRTTWWIWSGLEIMLSASYVMSGAGSTMWLPIAAFIGMLLTAILSLFYGKKEWTAVDTICSVGSIIGLIVWYITGSSVIALCSFLTIDILAAIPTFVKSYKNPYEEDLLAWKITLFSGLLNLIALDSISFAIWILPVYNLAIYAIVVAILMLKRRE